MTDSLQLLPLNRQISPESLSGMTFPAYRHYLRLEPTVRDPAQADGIPVAPVGVLAVSENRPVGMILGEVPLQDGVMPEIVSLFVVPDQRQRGIGTALVDAFAQEVASRGFRHVRAVYMTGKASVAYIERILARNGWESPETRMLSLRFSMDRMATAAWVTRYALPEEYSMFLWSELPQGEMEEIRRSHEAEPWIASDLLPWDQVGAGYEEQTSIGIRYHGKVVGWVINHAIDETTLRFTCSFIRKPLGRMGRIVPAYGESFRRARQAGFRVAHFTTPLGHKGMAAFARRWIAPWSDFVGETRGAIKQIGPANQTGS